MRTYRTYDGFQDILQALRKDALEAPEVPVATWHQMDVRGSDAHISKEIPFVSFQYIVPPAVETLQREVEPNLPWAEDHFQERVCGEPLNPSPSEAWWPYAMAGNRVHKEGEQFSHTYPERMWPKFANIEGTTAEGRQTFVPHMGLRFGYGDLFDVVDQFVKDPYTRQGYLPIWFPEDTGATQGQRVPCTLGYHFLFRQGGLHLVYPMRSCDLMRHFQDDVYMACRLMQWMCGEINDRVNLAKSPLFVPGILTMHISSLHIFRGDVEKLREMVR